MEILRKLLLFIANSFRNWQTASIGIATIAIIIAYVTNHLTGEQVTVILGILMGTGFLAAKDANKTGTL